MLEVRNTGTVASEVVRDVLRTCDVEESLLDIVTVQDDATVDRVGRVGTGGTWEHHKTAGPAVVTTASSELVCVQCLDLGVHWVSLRRCLACGNVACCDSSPYKHATEHFHDTTHPAMQSAQPGEDWRWCFVHHLTG